MRSSLSFVVGVAGLMTLPACPLLDASADVQETCISYPGVQVPAMPASARMVDQSFTVGNLDSFKTLADQGFTLAFAKGTVTATSGISDFTFVTSAQLSVASGDPSSTLPTLDVFDCDGCTTSGSALTIDASSQTDAAPYVETGSLVVSVVLAGTPPAVAWSMDVDVCMTGQASYQLGD